MTRRRKKLEQDKKEKYRQALKGRKIPILTLDNKWHKLFTQTGTTREIEALSQKMNELLKRQGRLGTDMKDIRHVKKKLMDAIVNSMDGLDKEPNIDRKMDESRRLIEECNEKLNVYEEEYLALPKEIEEINQKLMICIMELCYDKMRRNTEEINVIADWITKTRVELKQKILLKQDDEIANQELYSYMHDIFGAEVLEIFDMEYNPAAQQADRK